jgi:hypothetical protein
MIEEEKDSDRIAWKRWMQNGEGWSRFVEVAACFNELK